MGGNRLGKVAVGVIVGVTVLTSAPGQTAPPPPAETTAHYYGLRLRVPSGFTIQTRTPWTLVMTKITPPNFYATVGVVRDPNHSAFQNATYLASRHAARLGGLRQWTNGSGYLFRLGQQYVLLVPNPRGAFSLALDVTVPRGQSGLAHAILSGWHDPAIANPYQSAKSPAWVAKIRPGRGHLARTPSFHSVTAAGIRASVPINWSPAPHPGPAYLAEWLTGGLSTVDGVQFSNVPSAQVHSDLAARWTPKASVYGWPHRAAYIVLEPSRHLSDLSTLTEVIRRTVATALEVTVTVRTPDLATGLHVLRTWQYDGLNPYQQAGKLSVPGKLSASQVTKWLHARTF